MLVSLSQNDWPLIALLYAELKQSPFYLSLAVGLIAFLESLAIIGLLVPGVAILFALMVLASKIQAPIAPLLISGAIGGFIGDLISFTLGKHLQHNVHHWKPIQKRPVLFLKAQVLCEKYGIYSLLIGRFIGPLRPLMPLTAGVLDFRWNRFTYIALLGACLWSLAYLLPGYYSTEFLYLVVQWIKDQLN